MKLRLMLSVSRICRAERDSKCYTSLVKVFIIVPTLNLAKLLHKVRRQRKTLNISVVVVQVAKLQYMSDGEKEGIAAITF